MFKVKSASGLGLAITFPEGAKQELFCPCGLHSVCK